MGEDNLMQTGDAHSVTGSSSKWVDARSSQRSHILW